MPGRFTGISDEEWAVLEPLFSEEQPKKKRGRPKVPKRKVLNTILYVLITGSRWCDVPKGEKWASKSTAHRWLGKWMAEGRLERALKTLLERGYLEKKLDLETALIDASFSPWKGGRRRGRLRT